MKKVLISFAIFICAANVQAQDQVTATKGSLKFFNPENADFKYSLGGFTILDFAFFQPDVPHSANWTPQTRGRAMRIDFQGTMYKNFGFRGMYDFFGNATRVRQAYISYRFSPKNLLRIGMVPTPMGMESETSIRWQMAMERALLHRAWGIAFTNGIELKHQADNHQFTVGAYDDDESKGNSGARANHYIARASYAPIHSQNQSLHIGTNGKVTNFQNGLALNIKATAGGTLIDGGYQLIGTGAIADADNLTINGFEFAYSYKNFGVMSEYSMAKVERSTPGADDLEFSGYYANLVWLITGERFPYNPKTGALNPVKPNKPTYNDQGGGAWALTLRYDTLDLADTNLDGGKQTDTTLALNFYPNNNFKFVVQHTLVSSEKANVDDNPSVTAFRAQASF